MSDMMTFPATVEEFMEQYKIVDDEKVYTNGADLIPIFRMMQWFEHVSATDKNVGTNDDCISRKQAIEAMCTACGNDCDKSKFIYNAPRTEQVILCPEHYALSRLLSVQHEQRTDLLKVEIKRMKRSFTTCINSDYYTGYMSALSAVEGCIAQWEGANNEND